MPPNKLARTNCRFVQSHAGHHKNGQVFFNKSANSSKSIPWQVSHDRSPQIRRPECMPAGFFDINFQIYFAHFSCLTGKYFISSCLLENSGNCENLPYIVWSRIQCGAISHAHRSIGNGKLNFIQGRFSREVTRIVTPSIRFFKTEIPTKIRVRKIVLIENSTYV
jgi:hypothetical protein